jgi:hypothetical protein
MPTKNHKTVCLEVFFDLSLEVVQVDFHVVQRCAMTRMSPAAAASRAAGVTMVLGPM